MRIQFIPSGIRSIPMVLHCPACGLQHIDTPDEAKGWMNPPHRSHLCHHCGYVWRPADVFTQGVQAITTRGQNDSPAPAPSGVPRCPDCPHRPHLGPCPCRDALTGERCRHFRVSAALAAAFTAPSGEERQAPPGELPGSDSAEAPKGAPSSGEVHRPTWPAESTTGVTPEAAWTLLEDEDGAPFPDEVQRAFRTALAAANAELAALREDNASLRAENSRTHVRWEGEYATLQVKLEEAERQRDELDSEAKTINDLHTQALVTIESLEARATAAEKKADRIFRVLIVKEQRIEEALKEFERPRSESDYKRALEQRLNAMARALTRRDGENPD